ncbi:hypothetical protein C8F01DRAFT_1372344 [Mycena amicta]|nr:hypothetical protein C8F01DRAFT_1372344 [Mycena amicta]
MAWLCTDDGRRLWHRQRRPVAVAFERPSLYKGTPWDLSGQTVPDESVRPHMEWLEATLRNRHLCTVQPMYEDVFRDGRIRRADWSLGQSLQQLAITFVCIDRLASSSTMELGTIRDGCASAELFGRLGLLYDVHRYMRHSYTAEGWYIFMGQSREGLCALMTYIFVHKDLAHLPAGAATRNHPRFAGHLQFSYSYVRQSISKIHPLHVYIIYPMSFLR